MHRVSKNFIILSVVAALFSFQFQFAPVYAANGSSIFTISYNGGVKKIAIDGSGSSTSLGTGYSNVALAATENYLYFGYRTIKRMNLDGSNPVTLRSVSDAYNFVITDNYIYYGYEFTRKIGRMNLDGTGANDSWLDYSSNSSAPFSAVLLVNGNDIYFGGGNNGGLNGYAGSIWKTTTSGTTPVSFTSDTNANAGIQDMVTDGTYLYWSNYAAGTIGRVLLDGSSNTSNWITGVTGAWGMDIAGTTIYFNHSSNIGKISTDGTGLNKTWASNGGSAQALAIGGVPATATLSLELVSGAKSLVYRRTTDALLRATFSSPGKVTFFQNGKVIPGCRFLTTSSGTVDCSWKPSIHGLVTVYATITSPTSAYPPAKSSLLSLAVAKRTNLR